ncbi:MAG TPA: FliO/MopB family protein [Candidatus Brocadiia bacterium]|nr:flagellar biosynthetic protein FliO [Planctomycetota bacterium]MBI4007353.1 flagellar biosynthetic protein FliO [Planctomycetota bacterium]MDO8093082.1 flagellar biosynthetic protein FliO [Candidatus Brocadiales bacterium]
MKNHYYIGHVLILGILLVFASTEILAAEDSLEPEVGSQKSRLVTPDSGLQTPDSKLQTQDSITPEINSGQVFFPKLTRVLQSTAIVIILIVGTVFLLKKKFGLAKVAGKKYIHVVESVSIGTKRFLLLVKIPGKLLVVGMANDRINPLAEITDKEVVDAVSPSSDNNDFMSFMKKVCFERRQVRAGVRENNH